MNDLRAQQRRALALLMAHGTLRASVLGRLAGYNHKDVAARVRTLRARGLVELEGGSKGHSAACRITDRGRRVATRLGVTTAAWLLLAACCGGAEAHDWYTGLKIPSGPMAGASCCSSSDCQPTEYCVLPTGKQGLVSRFGCVTIPWDKVLGVASPDGKPSLCEAPYTTTFVPYCVILGGEV